MNIDPTGRVPGINVHHDNYGKVALNFTDGVLSGETISYWTWTFKILISTTHGSKNKYDVGNISVKLPTSSQRAAVMALNKNTGKILDQIVNLIINSKNEMNEPSTISTRLGGDNQPKDREFTINIINTPELKDMLFKRGVISQED